MIILSESLKITKSCFSISYMVRKEKETIADGMTEERKKSRGIWQVKDHKNEKNRKKNTYRIIQKGKTENIDSVRFFKTKERKKTQYQAAFPAGNKKKKKEEIWRKNNIHYID